MSATTREGSVYRRCTQCGANLTGKTKAGEPRADVHAESGCEGAALWAFRVDVSPPGAPRRQRRGGGFATKAAALEAMGELQREYRRGEAVEPSKMTVGQFLDGWLEVVKATKAAGTAENRKHHLAYIKRAGIADIPLQALTELDVERMCARLAESGRANGKGGLKPRSIADVNTTLVTSLNEAVRKRLIPRNVAEGAYRASAHASADTDGVFAWTADELAAWEEVAAQDVLYPLWRFLVYSGCRKGEAIGLLERELDLSAGLVTFTRARTKGESGQVEVTIPKSARSRRTIDLDPATVDVLREDRRARKVVAIGGGSALAFTLPDGTPLHPDGVRTRMKRLVKAAGVPPLSPHGLRHTHATLMLKAGVPLHVVSRRLGHANESFTASKYAHVLNGQGSQAASTFADLVARKEAQ